ncbi:MAG: thrombospondin type 3 repeat-containing protein [Deltaproteobacteria bacterium]|nr:thrombospondin type 3 repeat-containing protein [Deltaproteobacteria bacterium]
MLPPLDLNDVDADGVPNDEDLCPKSYDPDQHDEDGDAVGDSCDVCPSIVNPTQSDVGEMASFGFGDGVGDACDPRPARDGDRLVYFDTFAVDSSSHWVGSGWQPTVDVARAIGEARWEAKQKLESDGLLAQIQVTILTWLGPGSVEVSVNGDGSTAGVSCAIVHGPDGDQLVAREVDGLTMAEDLGVITGPVTMTAWRTISRERIATFLCRVDEHELEMRLGDEIPAGTYGFASSGAITDVASIAVYTFPINPCAFVAGAPLECNTDPF